jgi:cytoskeletal protein CcmA (bactofilin family)
METENKRHESAHGSLPENLISKGTHLIGKLNVKNTLRICGNLTGSIKGDSSVTIEEGAHVRADVRAHTLNVYGELFGKVISKSNVLLAKTAHFEGDIESPRLIMEPGAFFKGQVIMD